MEYVKLGNSDLHVSRICLGCMGFGDPTIGQHSWTIGEDGWEKDITSLYSQIDEVTAAQIQQVAQELMAEDRLTTLIYR